MLATHVVPGAELMLLLILIASETVLHLACCTSVDPCSICRDVILSQETDTKSVENLS